MVLSVVVYLPLLPAFHTLLLAAVPGMMRSDYGCDALKGDMTVSNTQLPVNFNW